MEIRTLGGLADVEIFAQECVKSLEKGVGATVIALKGDLGAGKTTFVQACARALGVLDIVTSPTFLVMKRYALTDARFSTLIHIDAYRVDDEQELEVLKLRESLEHGENLIMIEWAERCPSFVPNGALRIEMVAEVDGSRTVTYGKDGKKD